MSKYWVAATCLIGSILTVPAWSCPNHDFTIWASIATLQVSGVNETASGEHSSIILSLKAEHCDQPWSIVGDLNGSGALDSCSNPQPGSPPHKAELDSISCQTWAEGCPAVDGSWQATTKAKLGPLPDKEDQSSVETLVCECT